MRYRTTLDAHVFDFEDLRQVMACASPARSGDYRAEIGAATAQQRMAARHVLADTPLRQFLTEALIPYESDNITRLIIDGHDAMAFAPVSHLTVGGLRDWLLSEHATTAALSALASGLTPEMVAAVSKLMRNQDLIAVARKCSVVTRFRNTIGLPGHMAVRLQPNHPTDDLRGVAASTLDGLLYGAGDAVIGLNPASDSLPVLGRLLHMLDEAHDAARSLGRGTLGDNVMYFETGQGSALSADAGFGVDQQTCEVRAYALARRYRPLLINTVVGFIGPEYLFDGKQIIRAGLEDHCCGKLLGLPIGCDVCYTNHAEADQDDMDTLLVLLATAGLTFLIGVPGADDVMLNYQSTSFHDALFLRETLGLKRAPEFEAWLQRMRITDDTGRLAPPATHRLLADMGRLPSLGS